MKNVIGTTQTIKKQLDELKIYPRESYISVVSRLARNECSGQLGIPKKIRDKYARTPIGSKINDAAYAVFADSPCPEGSSHDIRINQLGPENDRLCNDPLYHECIKCHQQYWSF